jgi:polyisoprenoid-binding protein YceI
MGQASCISSRRPVPASAAIRTGSALALSMLLALSAMPCRAGDGPGEVPTGTYMLDQQRSSVFLIVGYAGGLLREKVRFTRLQGELVHVRADAGRSRVVIKVDSTSADSGQSAFNRTIATSLGSERHPTITFVSRELTLHDERHGDLDGDLTLRGVTRPLRLHVVMQEAARGDGDHATRIRFSGKGRIRRSDFGVRVPAPFARDVVLLSFEVAFSSPETR